MHARLLRRARAQRTVATAATLLATSAIVGSPASVARVEGFTPPRAPIVIHTDAIRPRPGSVARQRGAAPDVASPAAAVAPVSDRLPDAATGIDVGSGDLAATSVEGLDAPTPAPPPPPRRVLYVGDSMAWATAGELQDRLPGTQVDALVFGGTAPCDWARGAVADHPQPVDAVVFSFIGNNMTECAGHATGDALLAQYRDDLTAICEQAAPARCVAVGQPALGPAVDRNLGPGDQPTSMYRHEAAAGRWEFVDAGAAVETAVGGFDAALRDGDGVHFNEAGAERFAAAIADYLLSATS